MGDQTQTVGGGGAGTTGGAGAGGGQPSGSTGVFSAIPALSLPKTGAGDTGATGAAEVLSSEGTVPSGAGAAGDKGGATATATADPTKTRFHAPLLGRHWTWAEADEAMRRNQIEAKRLDDELRKLQSRVQTDGTAKDAELADLRSQLEYERKNGGFKELDEEALTKLAADNPRAYYDYMRRNEKREAELRADKEYRTQQAQARDDFERRMGDKLADIDREMRRDTEMYPMYAEFSEENGPIQAIIDMTRDGPVNPKTGQRISYITGHEWTHALLYLAALGRSYLQAMKEGKKVTTEAERKAQEAAAAAAAGGRGPAGGGHTPPGTKEKSPDEKYAESVLAAGSQGVFGAPQP